MPVVGQRGRWSTRAPARPPYNADYAKRVDSGISASPIAGQPLSCIGTDAKTVERRLSLTRRLVELQRTCSVRQLPSDEVFRNATLLAFTEVLQH
jgi:hypothetical protein